MTSRRAFFRQTLGIIATGGIARTVGASTETDAGGEDAELAWRRSYPDTEPVQAVAPTGDGGFVYCALRDDEAYPNPVTLTAVDRRGRVRRRTSVTPAASTGVGGATPCALTRIDGGFALARGGWLALLDDDLVVRSTTVAPPEAEPNGDGTFLAARPDGVVVAQTRWLPQGVETHVHGFTADGRHRWTERHGHRFEASFLVPADGGVAVGGTEIDRGGSWIAVHDPDGTRRWRTEYETERDGDTTAAAADAAGVTVAGPDGLLRVGWDGSLRWREPVRAFPAVDLGHQTLHHVFVRPNGGYVLVGTREETPGRYAIVGVTGDRRREWRFEFEAGRGSTELTAGVRPGPGTILLAGGQTLQSEPSSVAILVTGPNTRPPTPTRTESPTRSPTGTSSPTATPSPSQTPTGATDTAETADRPTTRAGTTGSADDAETQATETTLPGVGPASATVTVAGLGAWLARRWHRDE